MFSSLRPRSVYDLLAVIGCFAALTTGAAYAANTIGSADVIDESLVSRDLMNDHVKGQDILESSLGPVPVADTLDGQDSTDFARLSGFVFGDGSISQGSGFTAERIAEGEYRISFPVGTLGSTSCPVAVAMVFGGLVRHPQMSTRTCSGQGAGAFTVKILDNDGVAHDNAFFFLAK